MLQNGQAVSNALASVNETDHVFFWSSESTERIFYFAAL